MCHIEHLINTLCSKGVNYIELSKMADIGTGNSDRKDAVIDGDFPFYVRSKDILRINKYEYDETAIIIPGEGGIGEIFHYVEGKYALHQRAYRIHVKDMRLDTKFLYYYMFSRFKAFILQKAVNSTVKSIRKPMIEKFPVPVPPLEIQREIVHILDRFILLTGELTEELTGELRARKKQYEFYRDKLLSFENRKDIAWIPLKEVSTDIYRGTGIKKDEVTDVGIPCVRYGEIYTKYNVIFDKCISHTDEKKQKSKKYFEYGDILFAITGESVEDIAKSCVYVGKEKCMAGGDIVVMKHKQNPRYLAYALSTTNAQQQKSKGKVKSKVVHSSVPAISEILVPIPTLEEQDKIANILDKFDYLCDDITKEILAEIEARKKQYEYYRDKLLTFKERTN